MFERSTLKDVTDFFSFYLDRPVIDRSGIEGDYDVTLEFTGAALDGRDLHISALVLWAALSPTSHSMSRRSCWRSIRSTEPRNTGGWTAGRSGST